MTLKLKADSEILKMRINDKRSKAGFLGLEECMAKRAAA